METVYGINPVRVLLSRDHSPLKKIIIARGRGGAAVLAIIEAAGRKNIPLEWQERRYLDKLTGGTDHQGVVAVRGPFMYAGFDDVLKNRNPGLSCDLVVILDSVVDPHNLGSIIRTSHCLGANGIILPMDRAAMVTPAVIKVSAGSAVQLPVARVTNLARTIDELKERGFWIFGADTRSEFPLVHSTGPGRRSQGDETACQKKMRFSGNDPHGGRFRLIQCGRCRRHHSIRDSSSENRAKRR